MSLLAIKYQRGHLEILNQLLLPHKSVYEEIKGVEDGWQAIRTMKVSELLMFQGIQDQIKAHES